MKKIPLYWLIFLLAFSASCIKDDGNNNNSPSPDEVWLIPVSQVFSGGPGKDGIPSIDSPKFISVAEVSYLVDEDIVIVVKMGNSVKAYPHPILDWHEIVNDEIDNTSFSLTYCPLTGTAVAWNREIEGSLTTFGVSGLLYNSNLIPYDRKTGSNWSQMRSQCVNGELISNNAEIFHSIEMSWKTFRSLFPNGRVLDDNTGVYQASTYNTYPYGDYKANDNRILFPVSNDDLRLNRKQRVLTVSINSKAKAYQFTTFPGEEFSTLHDEVGSTPIVVFGSSSMNMMTAYESVLTDGTALSFEAVQGEDDVALEDNEGTRWNIFGEATAGPRVGEQLNAVEAYMGYWFAWGTFRPGLDIYDL